MRELRQLAWAAAVAAATAGAGLAQQTTSGAGGSLAGTPVGGGSLTAGGAGTGAGASGNSLAGQLAGTSLATMQAAPTLSLPSTTTTSTALSQSNGLGRFYANPYYLGIYSNSINPNAQPGGFGVTLYQTGIGTGGGQIGFSGSTGGVGGGTGRGGLGGIGGTGGSIVAATVTDAGGILVPLPRAIAYPARVRFASAPPAPSQLLADLRGVIDRAPMLANPAGVQVRMDGNAVLLRGSVRDEDEARLVEGLVRLTPGVGPIRNELTFPAP